MLGSGAETRSGPCRIAGHSGSCTEIPRKSATRSVGEEGGEQDYYCSQNKPASDYKPKSSGKMSATRPRNQPLVPETEAPRR